MARNLTISLVNLGARTGPEAHGLAEFLSACAKAGIKVEFTHRIARDSVDPILVVGRSDSALIRTSAANPAELPVGAESAAMIRVERDGRTVLLVTGGDSAGLMYALLELAERVRVYGSEAIEAPAEFSESPDLSVRGVDRFLSGHLDDEWFQSDEFWTSFLDKIARNRFNRFVLITGFDTAYMSPPYPYFVDVPGFPGVGVDGLTDRARARNVARIRTIGKMCAERSVEFLFGIWQQIPWQTAQSRVVTGLPDDEDKLAEYCAAGLKELVIACPEITGIHLRVNHEAGVGTQTTAEGFWNTLTDAVTDAGRELKLDLRAKGLTDGMIEHAISRGLTVSVPTKYWCEHTGLPHHLTQMRSEELTQLGNLNHARRYSYSDLLKKPRAYDMIYRLWNLGSTNLFLWGEPDYVQRYCASMRVGDAPGFEIASPLSLKWGHELRQKEAWPLFVDDALVSSRFEDDRYWYVYALFGRLGYSATTDSAVFEREFSTRFGAAAGMHVARAYAASGKVLPLVTAMHMPAHPMLQYWPELSTGGALFAENQTNRHFRDVTYGTAEPSDPGLFYGIDEYAADLVANRVEGKYSPVQVASWLSAAAAETRAAIADADKAPDLIRDAEWRSSVLDFSMISDLAEYHEHKIHTALNLALFRLTGDGSYHAAALAAMHATVGSWRSLARRGTGTYRNPLDFQVGADGGRCGHWNDSIGELEQDLATLENTVASRTGGVGSPADRVGSPGDRATPGPIPTPSRAMNATLPGRLVLPEECPAGRLIAVELRDAPWEADAPTLHYRRADQTEGEFRRVAMQRRFNGFAAEIPAEYVTEGLDLLVYVSDRLSDHETVMAPGLYNPTAPLPYAHIRVSQRNRGQETAGKKP